jgi:hypothetical protein
MKAFATAQSCSSANVKIGVLRASAKAADDYEVPGNWIAERVRAEALRNRIGEHVLARGRHRRRATNPRIGAEQSQTRHWEELLSGRGRGDRRLFRK